MSELKYAPGEAEKPGKFTREGLSAMIGTIDDAMSAMKAMAVEALDAKGPRPEVFDVSARAYCELAAVRKTVREAFAAIGVRPL